MHDTSSRATGSARARNELAGGPRAGRRGMRPARRSAARSDGGRRSARRWRSSAVVVEAQARITYSYAHRRLGLTLRAVRFACSAFAGLTLARSLVFVAGLEGFRELFGADLGRGLCFRRWRGRVGCGVPGAGEGRGGGGAEDRGLGRGGGPAGVGGLALRFDGGGGGARRFARASVGVVDIEGAVTVLRGELFGGQEEHV